MYVCMYVCVVLSSVDVTTAQSGLEKELSKVMDLFTKLFQKTGCLITADGSDDDKIRPQGLDPYLI